MQCYCLHLRLLQAICSFISLHPSRPVLTRNLAHTPEVNPPPNVGIDSPIDSVPIFTFLPYPMTITSTRPESCQNRHCFIVPLNKELVLFLHLSAMYIGCRY